MTMALSHARRHRHPSVPVMVTVVVVVFGALAMLSVLLEAGEVGGQARTALIIRAGSIGDAGDTAFDRGTARVQAARRALGLGVDPRFSDVPTGTTRDSR